MIIDVRTLLLVLVLGNLVSALMIVAYRATVTDSFDLKLSNYYIASKFMQVLGYSCLFARGVLPDILSVSLGNTVLIAAICVEAIAMLTIVHRQSKRVYIIEFTIAALLCVGFNVTEFINPDPTVRIVSASISIFAVLIVPVGMMILSKQKAKFMRIVVACYVLSVFLMLVRAFYTINHPIGIHSNTWLQTLTFLALVLLMFASASGYLLLMKENSDRIIRKLATTDSMTGLANRNNFFAIAELAFDSHRMSRKPLSMLFIDVDDFKVVNDSLGHPFGDRVLMALSDALRQSVRSQDVICRYGGDEMVVMLVNIDIADTQKVYERLIDHITASDFDFTVSVGAMNGIPSEDDMPLNYIEKADMALYAVKNAGKASMAFYQAS